MRRSLIRTAAALVAAAVVSVAAAGSASACEKHDGDKPKPSFKVSAKATCDGNVTVTVKNTSGKGGMKLDATVADKAATGVKPGDRAKIDLGTYEGDKATAKIEWRNGDKDKKTVDIDRPSKSTCTPDAPKDPYKGNWVKSVSTVCAPDATSTVTISYNVHEDDSWLYINNKQIGKLDAGTQTYPVKGLAAGTYKIQLGDEDKIDSDDPFVMVTVAQCEAPKINVTAPTIQVGCGYVITPPSPFIGFEALVNGQWVKIVPGKHVFSGEMIQIRPYVTQGNVNLTNPDTKTYELAGDECVAPPKPKVKVAAGVVKVVCGGVIPPVSKTVVFKKLVGGKYVTLKASVINRIAGKTVTVKPFLLDTVHYTLVNSDAKTYNLKAMCPKVRYVTLKYQVDVYSPATKAQASAVAGLDNDGLLTRAIVKGRNLPEDYKLFGRSRYEHVTVNVPVGSSCTTIVKAINAKTRVGDVRTCSKLAGAVTGKAYVFAWQLGKDATAAKPWGPGPKFSVAQKFFARS